MSKMIERLINDYPSMLREQSLLRNQILGFKGLTQVDMIESMSFDYSTSERVQTSSISEKTAQIAINYESRIFQMNREWIKNLEMEYALITEEIIFFKSAMNSLPNELALIMIDLVINRMTWDEVSRTQNISRTLLAKRRAKSISELDSIYTQRESKVVNYLLS